jgi:hypothetical protein
MDQQQGSQPEATQAQTPPQDAQQQTTAPQNAQQVASQQTDTPASNPATPTAPSASSSNEPKILSSETTPHGKPKGMFFIIAIALIVIITGVGYVALSKHSTPPQTLTQKANVHTVSAEPSPGVTPVTAANVDQTLNNADSTMQQTVNQANTDLNSVSNIDSSQDSTSGL